MIKRWYKNLVWLLNHPPTAITMKNNPPCDYCGALQPTWNYEGCFTIFFPCRKKAFDKVLKNNDERSDLFSLWA